MLDIIFRAQALEDRAARWSNSRQASAGGKHRVREPGPASLERNQKGTPMATRSLVLGGMLVLLAVHPSAPVRGDDAEAVAGDLKLMQGTWSFKPAEDVDVTWSLKGETLKATAQGQEYVCKVTLNAKVTPRTIDFFVTQGPNEIVGRTALGIYKIENDTVTFCVSRPGDDRRPTEFKDVEDECYLFSIGRAK
jgi:uncharacterized protein (TIGR03067 family)